jgi:hypothetical protein
MAWRRAARNSAIRFVGVLRPWLPLVNPIMKQRRPRVGAVSVNSRTFAATRRQLRRGVRNVIQRIRWSGARSPRCPVRAARVEHKCQARERSRARPAVSAIARCGGSFRLRRAAVNCASAGKLPRRSPNPRAKPRGARRPTLPTASFLGAACQGMTSSFLESRRRDKQSDKRTSHRPAHRTRADGFTRCLRLEAADHHDSHGPRNQRARQHNYLATDQAGKT